MKTHSGVYIWIDLYPALKDGILFYLSRNGVVLTEGEGNEGALPLDYAKGVGKEGGVGQQ